MLPVILEAETSQVNEFASKHWNFEQTAEFVAWNPLYHSLLTGIHAEMSSFRTAPTARQILFPYNLPFVSKIAHLAQPLRYLDLLKVQGMRHSYEKM
jgi:hypothetical protein